MMVNNNEELERLRFQLAEVTAERDKLLARTAAYAIIIRRAHRC